MSIIPLLSGNRQGEPSSVAGQNSQTEMEVPVQPLRVTGGRRLSGEGGSRGSWLPLNHMDVYM